MFTLFFEDMELARIKEVNLNELFDNGNINNTMMLEKWNDSDLRLFEDSKRYYIMLDGDLLADTYRHEKRELWYTLADLFMRLKELPDDFEGFHRYSDDSESDDLNGWMWS